MKRTNPARSVLAVALPMAAAGVCLTVIAPSVAQAAQIDVQTVAVGKPSALGVGNCSIYRCDLP